MRPVVRPTAAIVALALLAAAFAAPVAAASSSTIPADVRFVSSWTDPLTGLVWDRYQQYAAPLDVYVEGGQLTIIRRGSRVVAQSGAYYPTLRVTSRPALSPIQATASAAMAADTAPARSTQLRVDPATGMQFYRVTTAAPGSVTYQDIDANTGAVLQTWSGIETDTATGTGVKGDTKSLAGDALTGVGALTQPTGSGSWRMVSADGRFKVSDGNNGDGYPTAAMTDSDNVWTTGNERAAVDAQYYAALTENFYVTKFGYHLAEAPCVGGQIRSIVHFSIGYANAFWDSVARVMVYGDGDSQFKQMSGAQDVVSHELSHAVTSCNADLDYIKESGALNEAFSDIMATTAEFEEAEPNSSNCVREPGQASCPDWWIGEDIVKAGSDHGFRSMSHPQVLGQPSHYADRVNKNTKTKNCSQFNDFCGVHTNSGIANHAFYLLSQGGRNARCSGPTDTKADCDVAVDGIGIDHAANIFFRAWLGLTSTSKFCDARNSSVDAAQYLADNVSGYSQEDVAATDAAWRAVGLGCGATFAFRLNPASDRAVAKPGGSANVAINIVRGTSSDPVTFSISDPAPATASFSPNPGSSSSTLHIDVPAPAAPGAYPLTVTGTDGTATQKVHITLVVDNDAPTAQVGPVSMAVGDTVNANGRVPLHVSWTSADATSSVASGSLSVDANPIASGKSGSATYSSANGTHQFQASATDEAGNTGMSDPRSATQASAQETPSATLVYTKTWTKAASSNAWSGATRYATAKAATAVYTFNGTDIAWVSTRGPSRGKAKVYVDGVLRTTVDLYAAKAKTRRIVFAASGLAAGQHSIKVYVLGTSGRPRVDIDGFVTLTQ